MRLYFLAIFFTFQSLHCSAQSEEIFVERYLVKRGETFNLLAQRFNLGINELLRANPEIEDQSLIYAGEKIILPITHLLPETRSSGIVINLAEPRLYFIPKDPKEELLTFPITIGSDKKTPTGQTSIAIKRENPYWIPPKSIRKENPLLPKIVEPGPNNPLGNYALSLDGSRNKKWQRIAIHGTNDPWSIGSEISHGCIRLYPKDIEVLFTKVEIGTTVKIVNQPLKLEKIGNQIYLESHFATIPNKPSEDLWLHNFICKRVQNCEKKIDWNKVDEVVIESLGIPINIASDSFLAYSRE